MNRFRYVSSHSLEESVQLGKFAVRASQWGSIYFSVGFSSCRNSQATPRRWRPFALPPRDLPTATASISCQVLRMIDCSVFGECKGSSWSRPMILVDAKWIYMGSCITNTTLSHCRQVREDGKDKNSVVSFTLTDEPRHIDLVASNSKEEVREEPIFKLKYLQSALNVCKAEGKDNNQLNKPYCLNNYADIVEAIWVLLILCEWLNQCS